MPQKVEKQVQQEKKLSLLQKSNKQRLRKKVGSSQPQRVNRQNKSHQKKVLRNQQKRHNKQKEKHLLQKQVEYSNTLSFEEICIPSLKLSIAYFYYGPILKFLVYFFYHYSCQFDM